MSINSDLPVHHNNVSFSVNVHSRHLFTQNLVTKEYIEIPFSKDSGNYHLPNEMHGSDHVPIGAKVLYR